MKLITFLVFLLQLNLWAGSHYYEGGAFFVTGLNESLVAKDDVEANFAVRAPAMMCGVYGTRKCEIKGFKKEIRQAAKEFLKPDSGPALAVFYSTNRLKLIEEYPDIKDPHDHLSKSPKEVILGDTDTESYDFGILTAKGFYVYKDGKLTRSFIKSHKGYLRGLLFYIEYLQDTSDTFYPRRWRCQLPKKMQQPTPYGAFLAKFHDNYNH